MGQPTPPGDLPLYEGLGTEWNDIVGAFPEDKRNELAPLLKSRLDEAVKPYEPLKQYEDFAKSGVNSEQIATALNVFSIIENRPREVLDSIASHLGLTVQEVQKAAQQAQTEADEDDEDPRLKSIEQQVQTLAQIALAQRQQESQAQQQKEQDAVLEKEFKALRDKHGEFDEEEVLMRMLHKNMSAEDAYTEYTNKVSALRQRRPAPMLMGAGGTIPRNAIDPTKLSGSDTKNLVAQMLEHARQERNS